MALGRTRTPSLAHEVGRSMAQELLPTGININLAPVLDVLGRDYNPALTIRSFGSDPALASTMGIQIIRGLQAGGLSATAKQFPGVGAATIDPHLALPTIAIPKAELEKTHLPPFRSAIDSGVDIVMTSHACYPSLDPTPNQPATFSKPIASDFLRGSLGFGGVVMTDDLTMGAITEHQTVEEASVKAAVADHDILLVAHHSDLQLKAFQAYREALDDGRIPPAQVEASRERVLKLIHKHKEERTSFSTEEETDATSLSEIIAGASTHVDRDPMKLVPVKRGTRVGILFPRLSDIGEKILIDDELKGVTGLMQNWIQGVSSTVDVLEIPVDPRGDLFTMIIEWASAVEIVVYFCFDAKQQKGQRRLLEELQRRCPKFVLIPMRNPWDRELAGDKTTVLQTYGFRVPQIASAIDTLLRTT
jgi:beta-N-acetylhexosaminidase